MYRHINKLVVGGALLLPMVAFAQTKLGDILGDIAGLLNLVTPIVVALALLFFFWALAMFILNSDDESARSTARQQMIYGIIVLFVIVAVWGLVQVVAATFSVDTNTNSGAIPGVDGV